MARRETAQDLTKVMERNQEMVTSEGSLIQVADKEVRDSITFSNRDLAI